ncbi:hypothetical protein SeMB42_g01588 [Synchytrium endobioticum]|uniref:Tyrosine specific protein phosphatases domain-containing protein n=1 Tax=Synchytrium endobioticum TaxID=286115 RepID=A0A507D1L6_9FUNG|nr:hypothetical protein SeLEV6574_g04060 [Synchytrium endobioticum]TPX52193.1 hypothetical protein SeMB42_g01588 [Synchytrium endobioticum]
MVPNACLPRNSLSHPINISWLLPTNTYTLLTTAPQGSDLLDALGMVSGSTPPSEDILSQRRASLPIPHSNGSSHHPCASSNIPNNMQRNGGREEMELSEAQGADHEPNSEGLLDVSKNTNNAHLTSVSMDNGLLMLLKAAGHSEAVCTLHKQGNLALSSCPGKKVRLDTGPINGRASIDRDLDKDFARMASLDIRTVVNCLYDTELQSLGAPYHLYHAAAARNGIQVLRLPMMEGSCPDMFDELDEVVSSICRIIENGGYVLCHCRGGIGRAGLVACCFLLRTKLCRTPERAVRLVRLRRSPKAIETQRQEDYISAYHQWLLDGRPPNRKLAFLGSIAMRSAPPPTFAAVKGPGVKMSTSSSWGPESRGRELSS